VPSISVEISFLICNCVVPGLVNNSVKNVSVAMWFWLQRRFKTFCSESVCNPVQPPMLLQNVLFCLFLSTCVVQSVCLCYGFRVCCQNKFNSIQFLTFKWQFQLDLKLLQRNCDGGQIHFIILFTFKKLQITAKSFGVFENKCTLYLCDPYAVSFKAVRKQMKC